MLNIKQNLGRATTMLVVMLLFSWSVSAKRGGVTGFVLCEGKGVAGVVVSDGLNVTKTNNKGAYSLPADSDKSQFVHLITSVLSIDKIWSIKSLNGERRYVTKPSASASAKDFVGILAFLL